ncbi:ImmA/IrrE family metallo-endopeptidase [Nocardioides lianchengensis]|uniref:IrrE N-terminal-like domain-containing protein n=1 Tax=Nocardioides lianchengensis TaxID=1045774 RepID=A0A1G6LN81_9ACTN|nr:ImmA/IrrE family metallo-endopeptidase [Nocardioides lianchengensis]NYG12498.1 hypothetical protein [Nocardioides lianchengensis]SDC44683.1 protein of unknown function [Nocardioides lianchengensis]
MSSYALTEPSNLSYSAISAYAEKVGEHHGIYSRDGVADIHSLVAKLGGHVMASTSRESLHVREIGDFTINVPATTSPRRDRFTIAHELGHYFLHYLLPKREGEQGYGRGGRNRAETEANVFASSLLMPESKFREQCHRREDAWRAALHFDVSPAAAEVRAQVLRIP